MTEATDTTQTPPNLRSRKRVGILISGRGTNMEALLAAASEPNYPAEIALVLSNRPNAPGLAKAEAAGVPTAVVDHTEFGQRETFEDALHAALTAAHVDIVCNAGFMRLLTPHFVALWRDRHLNIHPSLLPAFRGLNTHRRALEAGVQIAGATVHVVRDEMDAGPIIAQAAVPVVLEDTEETLAGRILAAEHRIYPLALALLASGRARVVGDDVVFRDVPQTLAAQLIHPPLETLG